MKMQEGGNGIDCSEDLNVTRTGPKTASDSPLAPNLSMLVLTGANFSGKSVYLKQAGLITIMAHLGW
jgi:DNA mismatch repair protein MSH5